MIKLEKTDVYGWEAAIRGMRNPMNSWDKSDTPDDADIYVLDGSKIIIPLIGNNDLALMKKLVNAGSDHSKFMRMITVTVDVTAPFYWWKEYDTYKVGTVANSCSTMHKIHAKEFTLDDFSHDHLISTENGWISHGKIEGAKILEPMTAFEGIVELLNACRAMYLKTNDKKWWYQMIQLLPTSYNQKRTIQLNYAVLRNIYHARHNHKLTEWHTFCDFIKTLPYSELITTYVKKEDNSNELP
jgi:hypothetical protein